MVTLNRRVLVSSRAPHARVIRASAKWVRDCSLPVPRGIARCMLACYLACRTIYHFVLRVFICEPLFKAYCREYGRGVRTDVFVHWIQGRGDIILGDEVRFDGKSSITFAARYCDRPTLRVGSRTTIGHNAKLAIGKRITIGSFCRISSDAFIFDSNGHATDPVERKAGMPPRDDEVRPVEIADNVWLGRRVTIYPGVRIGEGSIVSAGSVVVSDVMPYTIVAGNPARKIGSLPVPEDAGGVPAST